METQERAFTYTDNDEKQQTITLRRASAEWCNHDCPMIIYVANDGFLTRINAAGWIGCIESGIPDDVAVLYTRFVLASSRAWYRKYPQHNKGVNNFWHNFKSDLAKLRGVDYRNRIIDLAGIKE